MLADDSKYACKDSECLTFMTTQKAVRFPTFLCEALLSLPLKIELNHKSFEVNILPLHLALKFALQNVKLSTLAVGILQLLHKL
jgi:hypothetical protein